MLLLFVVVVVFILVVFAAVDFFGHILILGSLESERHFIPILCCYSPFMAFHLASLCQRIVAFFENVLR